MNVRMTNFFRGGVFGLIGGFNLGIIYQSYGWSQTQYSEFPVYYPITATMSIQEENFTSNPSYVSYDTITPIIGGVIGAIVGGVVGSLLPPTRTQIDNDDDNDVVLPVTPIVRPIEHESAHELDISRVVIPDCYKDPVTLSYMNDPYMLIVDDPREAHVYNRSTLVTLDSIKKECR